MRNYLYPYSMAQYIHPGSDSFLTQNKLAIPVGPNYRRILKKQKLDPSRIELGPLIKRVLSPLKWINDRRDEGY
jgi:hypothetical protein